MTHPEFSGWLNKLGSFFPSFTAWLMQMPPNQKNELLKEWWELLRREQYPRVQAASRQLWEDGGCPFGEIPPAILRIIRESRRESHEFADDSGPRWEDATDEEKAGARALVKDILRDLGPRHLELSDKIPRAVVPVGRTALGNKELVTLDDMREHNKTTAAPCRVETMAQYCQRIDKQKKRRR